MTEDKVTTREDKVLKARFWPPSTTVPAWPALLGPLPPRLRYERGIWGKAHGAGSDFRWLARSAGFARGHADLGRRLNLGLEDRPRPFTAWAVAGRNGYAVAAYPSRAADAAGRSGFLEKQVLEWGRGGDEPAVVGALTLGAVAAELDGAEWWSHHREADWSDPDFALPLSSGDDATSPEALADSLTAGLAELRRGTGEDALTELYAALFDQRHPACLHSAEPLPPRALACLLLPLPRELADRLSLTAWLPSRRYTLAELGRRWDVIAGPFREAFAASREATWERARLAARAVLLGDPGELSQGGTNGEAETAPSAEEERSTVYEFTVYEFPATSSWDDWTAAMRRNLTRTTDRLIERGLWPEWRRQALLQPRERLTTGLAWLTSEVWTRRDAPDAEIGTWNEVLDDVAILSPAHMKRICGAGWPWIPPHEERQVADLAAMASNLGDLARLAEAVASNPPPSLAGKPVFRNVLAESRFADRLPGDALLWLVDPRPAAPPPLDAAQWELLSREAGDRLDIALAARDLPDARGGNPARKAWWGFGIVLAVVVALLLSFMTR